MTGILQSLLGSVSSAVSAVTDAYFNLVTLLLPGNGTNGAQNNTFLDSSSNNFTITRNGNTTQGTFSPFSQTGWSVYFNSGQTNYFETPATVPSITGNYTAEAWIYVTSLPNVGVIFNLGSSEFELWVTTGNALVYYTGGSIRITTSTTISLNTWTHVALVRSSGIAKIYINGVADAATYNSSSTIGSGTSYLLVGRDVGASGGFNGYISNARVAIGAAVYTSNFTPPASPLGATSGGQNPPTGTQTYLLACQSNRIVDNSASPVTLTVTGAPSIQAFSPFAPTTAYSADAVGGSAYFDGTGDYLDSASNVALQLGSGDFSIEWWEYRDSIGADDTPVSTGSYSSAFAACLLGYSGTVGGISTNGSSWNVFNFQAYIDTLNAKSWNHFVYTRSGTAFRAFMNGKLSNYATGSGSVVQNNNTFSVGGNAGGGQYHMPGYISGFRVVKGSIPTSYQTSSTTPGTVVFTPPTAPPTTTSQGATANDVELLLNMTNAGITDATAKNDLETVGNAQISTTQSKFGGSSMYFDGTGDYLKGSYSPNMILSGDFTIECWLNFSAHGNYAGIVSFANSNTSNPPTSGWAFNFYSTTDRLYFETGTGFSLQATNAVTANQWNHVAIVRSGSTITHYLNGTANGSGTSSATFAPLATDNFVIGIERGLSGTITGYIDDLRISRYARYTGNFTPPTTAFPLQ